jgi:hypothetical protein
MPEEEEWISAASALALLGLNFEIGKRAICKRAHAGLVKARSQRFIHDGRPTDDVDIPVEFWWAEGERALNQNWATGDFDTWINHEIHLEAFGVIFRRSDIERLNPVPTAIKGQKRRVAEQKISRLPTILSRGCLVQNRNIELFLRV